MSSGEAHTRNDTMKALSEDWGQHCSKSAFLIASEDEELLYKPRGNLNGCFPKYLGKRKVSPLPAISLLCVFDFYFHHSLQDFFTRSQCLTETQKRSSTYGEHNCVQMTRSPASSCSSGLLGGGIRFDCTQESFASERMVSYFRVDFYNEGLPSLINDAYNEKFEDLDAV